MLESLSRRALLAALGIAPLSVAAKPKHAHKHKHHDEGHSKSHHHDKPAKGKRKDHHDKEGSVRALTIPAATPAEGPLVFRYGVNASNGLDRYQPRQLAVGFVAQDIQRNSSWAVTNVGGFGGWDVFPFGRVGGGMTTEVSPNWATFELARPAKLGYVWRYDPSVLGANPLPSWLAANGWVESGTIDALMQDPNRQWTGPWKVLTKEFPAGTATIPSPSQNGNPKILPWILFAETGGTPSPAPSVPAGKTVPVPNTLCPAWVHDQYYATNCPRDPNDPDVCRTWHLSHDSKYWCYFNHDHGSDPKLVCGTDAACANIRFGEIAKVAGMHEIHEGHKVYCMDYTASHGVKVMIVQHQGTWGLGRVNTCNQQYHLLEILVRTPSDRVYNTRIMADFGRSLGTLSQDGGGDPFPNVCNEQTGYTTPTPSRLIPIGNFCKNASNPPDNAYEPWDTFVDAFLASLGFGGNTVFNTTDPLTCPSDASGTTPIEVMTRSGTGRFFTANQMNFHCPAHANAQGKWWTDPFGITIVPQTDPKAVLQFCKPGWTGFAAMPSGVPENCHRGGKDMARWGDWAICVPTGEAGDFEGSITAAHGPN